MKRRKRLQWMDILPGNPMLAQQYSYFVRSKTFLTGITLIVTCEVGSVYKSYRGQAAIVPPTDRQCVICSLYRDTALAAKRAILKEARAFLRRTLEAVT